MAKGLVETNGRLIAAALVGAWRRTPPAFRLSNPQFERIAPLLLRSGAAALGWWRVRDSKLHTSTAAAAMRQAYRLNTLESLVNKSKIEKVFALLRSVNVEPIVIKGWAAARHYPEQGLRPYGDIDLCVQPAQYQIAKQALTILDASQYDVDLHCGFSKLGKGRYSDLYDRSQLAQLGAVEVRILGAEDHLQLTCFHLLREGAWRPLWLCDVAAALESLPARFDWERCLGGKGQAGFVGCVIGLAHLLLGAKLDDIPGAGRYKQLPHWLIPTVLNEWGSPFPSMYCRHRKPMLMHLRHPTDLWEGFRHRWPNPIEATISMNGPFNELPRLPFQIGACVSRGSAFLMRLPKKSWGRRSGPGRLLKDRFGVRR